MQPQTPYFMQAQTKSPKGPKAPLSKNGRILAVGGGAVALILIAAIFMSVLSSAGKGGQEQLLSVAQAQTELIRVSKLGIDRSRGTQAKNLATTVNLTMQSGQSVLLADMKRQKIKVDTKRLGATKKESTDKLLTDAEQANKFDAVFIQTIQSQLKQYQKTVDTAYDGASSKKVKAILEQQYKNANTLVKAK